MAVSCARSLQTLVTSCATIRWCSQMVLGIDGDLHIVADNASALTAGRHRAGIGIGQRDLFVGRGLNLLANLSEGLHLPLQALDLLLRRIVFASALSPSSGRQGPRPPDSARCWPPPAQCA